LACGNELKEIIRREINTTHHTATSWTKKCGIGVFIALLVLGFVELVLRLASFDHVLREKRLYNPKISGFIGTYQFFIDTFYAPPGYIWMAAPNTAFTDRYGFRPPELPFNKEPGKIRIAFLGGSTTQGGYRPYPERAIRLLNRALGTNRYEALNVACSSYSIHQSLKAFDRWVLPRNPDAIFVYHGWNDVRVEGDGYSDREKDLLISEGGIPRLNNSRLIGKLRLTSLLSWFYQATDHTWPRQRVSFEDFEGGLNYLANQCAQQNIKMVVMVRPADDLNHLQLSPFAPGSLDEQHAARLFNATDAREIYGIKSERIAAIQRKVAENYIHVEMCDGLAIVSNLNARNEAGEFGEQVEIFRSDHCHLYEFGDELLAQQVAMSIAPQHGAAISNYIESAGYLMSMAAEFYNEDAPRESAWFIKRVMQLNSPDYTSSELNELLVQSTDKFEFADKFRAGRMGGSKENYEIRIKLLEECLQMRPFDYGVMVQIYLVSFSTGHGDEAAKYMSIFTPIRSDHERDWLLYTLESHVTGNRLQDARKTAEKLLVFEPQNELARSVLVHGLPPVP